MKSSGAEPKPKVESREEFIATLRGLLNSWKTREAQNMEELSPEDLEEFGNDWRVTSLRQYLQHLLTWAETPGNLPSDANWQSLARLLDAGKGN